MKQKTKFLILGAGSAGLSFANRISQSGEHSFIVVEKEDEAGGLCRSAIVDGSPIDVGGGHFLDTRREHVNEFLFSFMPEEEWNVYNRKTTLVIGDYVIGQPIESHIWQLPIDDQIEYLKSISVAGCNRGQEMPTKFIDWIYWKLGDKIADSYMIPYNRKMFGEELNQLGTYWLEKLPSVSFEETLRSCLTREAYGKDPGHTVFYYPKKYGYGELWLRMAKAIEKHVEYNEKIVSIDFDHNVVRTDKNEYEAEYIISTIPWVDIEILTGAPDQIKANIQELRHSAIEVDYFPENMNTDSHWVYYPDSEVSYHRILVRHNFCEESKGYWTETNSNRVDAEKRSPLFSYLNEYAYPLNTLGKPEIMSELLEWCKIRNVYGLGRWGEHNHYNSDVTVERALMLADGFR